MPCAPQRRRDRFSAGPARPARIRSSRTCTQRPPERPFLPIPCRGARYCRWSARRAAGVANTSEDRLAEAVGILDHLVAFDTTSSRSNLDLIRWISDYLGRFGIAGTPSSAGEGKANLYATIGPADRGGVVLSGHTDVVPVAGQEWASDPFSLTERGTHLYGRARRAD